MPTENYLNQLTDILFEQARDFVGLYDVALGWFTRVNPAGYRLLGYPTAQALYDDPVRRLQASPAAPHEQQAQREHLAGAGRTEQELELRRGPDSTFWARVETTAITLDGCSHLVVRITNLEPLHQAEHRLAQSVGRFEAVFAHATIGIIVCNRPGDIVLANDKAQQLFGYPDKELLGQRIEVLVPDAVGRHHERLRTSFNAQPEVRTMGHNRDLLARRRDGSEFPVEISLSYFHRDDALFVVAYIIDITFKKDAERELITQRQRVERLNADLEQKVADRTHALMTTLEQLELRTHELSQALAAEQELGELKSRFVSMASHEFRTPLTAIATSASLIGKYPTTEQHDKRQRHIDRIQASVKHLTDILEEFLSVGKMEEGKLLARPGRLELPTLVQEAVLDVQGLNKPGQRIELDVASQQPLWLDASLLRKVLVNLLSNALKYSADNTVVHVWGRAENHLLTLRVQDHGMGIAPDDQEHLFERFFRARNVINLPGTGLGLYIIAKYLELLGGTIALQSELNVGTTVTITIPYEDENHPAD